MNIAPSAKITMYLQGATAEEARRLDAFKPLIKTLARLETAELSTSADDAKGAAQTVFGTTAVLLPLAGVIDVAKETERLTKEAEKLTKEIGGLEGRLNNEAFVAKAPEKVVAEQRARLADAKAALVKTNEAMARLKAL